LSLFARRRRKGEMVAGLTGASGQPAASIMSVSDLGNVTNPLLFVVGPNVLETALMLG